ncbi:MAG: exonuclease SbcCD subunit D C-terminal domain-containing protein [Faecalimonas umbilicata]
MDFCTVSGSLQEVLGGEGCEEYVKVVLTDGEDQVDVVPRLRVKYPNLLTVEFEGRMRAALEGIKKCRADCRPLADGVVCGVF